MGKTFDDGRFLKGLNLADKRVRRGAVRGMALLLAHGEKRGKELCPIDQSGRKPGGTLAGTIKGDAKSIKVTDKRIVGQLTAGGGEASDYAVRQHEESLTHSHPTGGVYPSKFIETPLKELAGKAPGVLADEIRRELG